MKRTASTAKTTTGETPSSHRERRNKTMPNTTKRITSTDDMWRILQWVAEEPDIQSVAEAAFVLGKPHSREETLLRQFAYELIRTIGSAFEDSDRLSTEHLDRVPLLL